MFLFLFSLYSISGGILDDLCVSYCSNSKVSDVQRFILHTLFSSILRDSLSDSFLKVLLDHKMVFSSKMVGSRKSLFKQLVQFIYHMVRSRHRVFQGVVKEVGEQERIERGLDGLGVKELARFRDDDGLLFRKFHDVVLSDDFDVCSVFSVGVRLLDEILTDVVYDLPFISMGATCNSFCLARSESGWSFFTTGRWGEEVQEDRKEYITGGLGRENFGSFLEMLYSIPLGCARDRSLGWVEFGRTFQVSQHKYHGLLGVYGRGFYELEEHDYVGSSRLQGREVSNRMLKFLERWGEKKELGGLGVRGER